MAEFIFKGNVTLHGVVFTVEAKNEKEAKAKAAAGNYKEYDSSGAETVDWDMDQRTMEKN